MDAPTPPPPPDPEKTAAAQTQSNRDTAISNAYLNRINQYGPNGSSEYQITGYGPNGEPMYRQDTKLSPEMQALYDRTTQMGIGAGDIGVASIDRLKDVFGKPLDLNAAAEGKIVDLQRARLDPQWAQQQEALTNRLAQRGIMPGSEAYDREMMNFSKQRTDAYNQMYLGARQQGVQEAMIERNQPLSEFNAFRTGSQPTMPTFGNVPSVTQANTDVAGIYNQAYQNELQGWNMQNQSNNSMMGGLFGIGAALMPKIPWPSDIRLKRDVKLVGYSPTGLGIYEWNYIWGGPRYRGFMAHEVESLFPDAVTEIAGGFKAVRYDRVP